MKKKQHTSLLPFNATPLERRLEHFLATSIPQRKDRKATPSVLRSLLDPHACPEEFLPWLAWGWSVDVWKKHWSVEMKRAVIAAAYEVHRKKGTLGAIKTALASLGYSVDVQEWWQTSPKSQPFTYEAQIWRQSGESTLVSDEDAAAVFEATKPVTRHGKIKTGVRTQPAPLWVGAKALLAEVIHVKPYQAKDHRFLPELLVGGRLSVGQIIHLKAV